jgi:hypothetical protein
MTNDVKKALFIFGSAFLIFWILKPSKKKKNKVDAPPSLNFTNEEEEPKDRDKREVPSVDKDDLKDNQKAKSAYGVLNSYIMAYNNKEPQSVLDELNREFAREFKLRVYRRKSDDKLVVCDLQGREVLVSK